MNFQIGDIVTDFHKFVRGKNHYEIKEKDIDTGNLTLILRKSSMDAEIGQIITHVKTWQLAPLEKERRGHHLTTIFR